MMRKLADLAKKVRDLVAELVVKTESSSNQYERYAIILNAQKTLENYLKSLSLELQQFLSHLNKKPMPLQLSEDEKKQFIDFMKFLCDLSKVFEQYGVKLGKFDPDIKFLLKISKNFDAPQSSKRLKKNIATDNLALLEQPTRTANECIHHPSKASGLGKNYKPEQTTLFLSQISEVTGQFFAAGSNNHQLGAIKTSLEKFLQEFSEHLERINQQQGNNGVFEPESEKNYSKIFENLVLLTSNLKQNIPSIIVASSEIVINLLAQISFNFKNPQYKKMIQEYMDTCASASVYDDPDETTFMDQFGGYMPPIPQEADDTEDESDEDYVLPSHRSHRSSNPEPVIQSEKYSATMLSGIEIRFEKQSVLGDGNCAILSLGCTREDISNLLLQPEIIQDKTIRERFYPNIVDALTAEANPWLYKYDEWRMIDDEFHVHNQNYSTTRTTLLDQYNLREEIRDCLGMRDICHQVITALLSEREVSDAENDVTTFNSRKTNLDGIEQHRKQFCTSQETFEAYALWLGNDRAWVDIESMKLYAEKNNIRLFIWRDSQKKGKTGEIILENTHQSTVPELIATRTLHILYSGSAHFDILQPRVPTYTHSDTNSVAFAGTSESEQPKNSHSTDPGFFSPGFKKNGLDNRGRRPSFGPYKASAFKPHGAKTANPDYNAAQALARFYDVPRETPNGAQKASSNVNSQSPKTQI
jgi:hypothetical protein